MNSSVKTNAHSPHEHLAICTSTVISGRTSGLQLIVTSLGQALGPFDGGIMAAGGLRMDKHGQRIRNDEVKMGYVAEQGGAMPLIAATPAL